MFNLKFEQGAAKMIVPDECSEQLLPVMSPALEPMKIAEFVFAAIDDDAICKPFGQWTIIDETKF